MDDSKTTQEKAYWAAEVAEKLKTNTSTLRNWTNALEKENYLFVKDEKGRRAFLDKDIQNLKLLQKNLKNNIKMKDAVLSVMASVKGEIRTGSVLEKERPFVRPLSADTVQEIVSEAMEKQQKAFDKKLEEQNKQYEEMMNQKLTEQGEFLLKKFNEVTEQRDRKLLSNIRSIQEEKEVQKEIATTIEEKQKTGFQKLLGFFKG
ncbi:MerR family transcriptional regulator [Bacillus cereus]|uniref:MerR family transcriptional regulator n=1 Tax=Bacillus cereus TaxID=1396 RepID=UPI002AC07819|nr:MerR family transcriptional regulator [Bacillus cereus]MDZ4508469.1 MerR family transcriptional regulator [Bacillus cereus]